LIQEKKFSEMQSIIQQLQLTGNTPIESKIDTVN